MMEDLFVEASGLVALGIEAIVVLILAVAAAFAVARLLRLALAGADALQMRREVWLKFGVAIALALEFSLAADIIRSVIAPSWEAIGQLGAIAAIRTLLNVFLMRDIETLGRSEPPVREGP